MNTVRIDQRPDENAGNWVLIVMRSLTIAAALAVMSQGHAAVYAWIDETGQVHYSDQWVPGCEEMKLSESLTIIEPVAPVLTDDAERVAGSREVHVGEEADEPVYRSLKVVSPAEDECLRRTGGIVKALVNIDPAPQNEKLLQHPGHRIRARVDGQLLESEILIGVQDGSLALFLTEVFRGTHQLQVTIEDADGQSLAQSQTVRFHVQQFSPIIREQQLREQLPPLPAPSTP